MSIIGMHVNWKRVDGREPSWKPEQGFGSLQVLDLDKSMVIAGDYGITTSEVNYIESNGNGIIIRTKNSIYSIEVWR